jgi:hypothetical protein
MTVKNYVGNMGLMGSTLVKLRFSLLYVPPLYNVTLLVRKLMSSLGFQF